MNTAGNPTKRQMRGDDAEGFPRPFGNYILLMAFARGGMGEVYLAKRGAILGAEKYCVLKKLRPELTEDREYVARFIDEARIVVQLNHANICQVFDVGRVGTEYYLAMEYVSGRDVRSLQDRARNVGMKLHEASVLYLLAETLSALDYAHRRTHPMTGEPLNLVHRDVSPQNVMVSFEGEVKLIDFGLASSRLKVERTQPNIVMGKMAYMAPEQARGDAIDRRTDLFATGVIGYELLAGERFYEGMSAQEIWHVVGRGGFVPSKWTELNPDLARILARALHPDPDSRFATCAELRDALMAYLHTKHPGLGERSLRELIHELYAEEIQRERDMLLGFAEVSGDIAEDLLESTRSQSVSLAHAGELPRSSGGGARIVHDERTLAAGALSSPAEKESPETQLSPSSADTQSQEVEPPDLADLPTQLGAETAPAFEGARTPPTGTITSSLEREVPVGPSGALSSPGRAGGGELVEETAVIVRAPVDTARTVAAAGADEGRNVRLVAAAAAILVVAIGAGFFFFASGGEEPTPPLNASAATVAATPPAEEAPAVAAVASDDDDAPPVEEPPSPQEVPPEVASEPVATEPVATEPVVSEPPPSAEEPADDEGQELEAVVATAATEEASSDRAAELRRAREARRLAAAKAREEREASRRAAAERAAREKEARRAQAARAQQPKAPRESIEQMVYAIVKCDLEAPCAKSGFVDLILRYKAGSMDANDRRSFEQLVRQCRKRCPR